MKKLIFSIFTLCVFFIAPGHSETYLSESFAEVQTHKWEVKDIGTVALFERAHALDLNDNGQVLLTCTTKDSYECRGIGNFELGFTLLPQLQQGNTKVIWLKINGDDTAIGIQNIHVGGGYRSPELVTWNKVRGVKKYNFDPSIKAPVDWVGRNGPTIHDHIVIAKCGNSSDIVLSLDGKIFTLQNGQLIDLTPKLDIEAQYHGFNFYKMSWKGLSVNNSGKIFGLLECFDKHPYKETTIFSASKLFHWDGKFLKFIDFPENTKLSDSLSSFYMNDNNTISFHWSANTKKESWIWDVENGPLELKELELNHGGYKYKFHVLAVLNDGTIVWFSNDHQAWQAILFQDEDGFLPIYFNEKQNIESSNYPDVKLSYPGYYPIINNQKEIILNGKFFGEEHPFLLTPVCE